MIIAFTYVPNLLSFVPNDFDSFEDKRADTAFNAGFFEKFRNSHVATPLSATILSHAPQNFIREVTIDVRSTSPSLSL